MNQEKNRNKIRGCLIGGAIGDALGYPIEFQRNIKDKQVTKFKNDIGIISDDTQMSLFTANALLYRETRGALRGICPSEIQTIYSAYLDWLDTQMCTHNHQSISWIKNIKELNTARAPGNTCIYSLSSGKMGTISSPLNNSKGCGGIMRVAPIGLYLKKDSKTAGRIGAESAAITHGHPLAIIPSYALACMINILAYTNFEIEDALDISLYQCYETFDLFNGTNVFNNTFIDNELKNEVIIMLEKNQYKRNEIYNEIYFSSFYKLVEKAKELAKENIEDTKAIASLGQGWVAEETFAIAIYSCLKYSKNFEKAIVCAVNHDGDSDSTGAVAGNIIGAYLGYNAIPKYYRDNVELKDVILELADDMSISVPVSQYSNNDNLNWINKYMYCDKSRKDDNTKNNVHLNKEQRNSLNDLFND